MISQKKNVCPRVRTRSSISPIEAGFGLVHAHTLVATTNDELLLEPPAAHLLLTVGGRSTAGKTSHLGLTPGMYDAVLQIQPDSGASVERAVRLRLVDPSRVRRQFGARYGSLEYDQPVVTGKGRTAPWDSLWKTAQFPDIVVDFQQPYKFVLWRGMSYAPSWCMDNVMTSFFFAETVEPGVYRDCCEMMSDRECRYSHARVVHNSSARVVIHWRYALNDPTYRICRDYWVDEIYFVYPDGVAVRNVTIHLDPSDPAVWQSPPGTGRRVPCSMIDAPAGMRTFNDMEFITVNAAGLTSDDNLPLEALTLLDSHEFSQTYCWPNPPDFRLSPMPRLRDYIFRVNYRGRPGTFVASPAEGLRVSLEDNTKGMRYVAGALVEDDYWERISELPTSFVDCIHWPVTRGYGTTSLTDLNTCQERPTHTFLGFANNAPVEVCANGAVTWSWLSGMVPEDEQQLRLRAGSWTNPCQIQGATYWAREGAYHVGASTGEVMLGVSQEQPVCRPTFVLDGWDEPRVRVLVNGQSLDESHMGVGVERSLDAVRTVVTLGQDLARGSRVQISDT